MKEIVNHKTSLRNLNVLRPCVVKCFRQYGCRCLPHRQAPLSRSKTDEQAYSEPYQSGGPEKRIF